MVANKGDRSNRLCQLVARSSCIRVFLPKRETTFEREECWIWLLGELSISVNLGLIRVFRKAWLLIRATAAIGFVSWWQEAVIFLPRREITFDREECWIWFHGEHCL